MDEKDPYTLKLTKSVPGIRGLFYGEVTYANGRNSTLLITRVPAYEKKDGARPS